MLMMGINYSIYNTIKYNNDLNAKIAIKKLDNNNDLNIGIPISEKTSSNKTSENREHNNLLEQLAKLLSVQLFPLESLLDCS